MRRRSFIAVRAIVGSLLACLVFSPVASAADGPAVAGKPAPPKKAAEETPLHAEIDRLIAAGTPGYENIAAPVASDAEFLRRVSLDLAGTIPTTAETRKFIDGDDPHKRAKLIDRLIGSPEYARRMQRVFDVLFTRRLPGKHVKDAEWEAFLRKSFAENKPYDQLVREILAADAVKKDDRGPALFYLAREADTNEVTQEIGRLFLGADLECAQCHDHPEVDDYTQDDYYGIAAFLNRSFVFTDKKQKRSMLAEKAAGEVSFESVFDVAAGLSDGPESTAPNVFGGPVVAEPAFAEDEAYKVKPQKKKNVRPVPKFSRRALLPQAITSSPRFPRTAANRLWALMLGRGLVHPLDRDHSGNPPSHPQLLRLLTRELEAHDYDVQWFLRELALSKTYQRSSRQSPPAATGGKEKSQQEVPADAFAQALLKPLTPAQFAWAILEATGEADRQRKALGDKLSEQTLHKKLAKYENRFVSLFGGLPGKPPEDFQSTVDQVLFLSNDGTVLSLVKRKNGNLADKLLELSADKPERIADELFLSVLTRRPSEQDIKDVRNYLQGRTGEDRQAAIQELIWALVASSEFRFNH